MTQMTHPTALKVYGAPRKQKGKEYAGAVYNRPLSRIITHVDLGTLNGIRLAIGHQPLTDIPTDGLDAAGGVAGAGACAFIAEGELFRIVPWKPSLQRKKGRPMNQHKPEHRKPDFVAPKNKPDCISPNTKSSDRTLNGRILRASITAAQAYRIKSTGGSVRVRWFAPGISPAEQEHILEKGFGFVDIQFYHGTERIFCGMQEMERGDNCLVIYILPFAWASEDDGTAGLLPANQ